MGFDRCIHPCKSYHNPDVEHFHHPHSLPQAITDLLFFFFVVVVVVVVLNLFILFLAELGLHCCARAFSSCGERGLLFVAVRGLLIAGASLVAEHGL